MKKTILWSVLFTTFCAQAQTTPVNTTAQPVAVPAATAPQNGAAVIDCNYKIDAKTKTIDATLVQTWAEKATLQTFNLDAKNLDEQMNNLKSCFTEQGWSGFNAALEQSGNLKAIKAQQLSVSSQIDGPIHADEIKDNLWKFTLPVQVIYQNDKEKVTQLLSVNITISRKATGLGITQMVAAPRTTTTAATAIGASSPSKDSNAAAAPTITSTAPDSNASTTPGASDTNGTTQPNPSDQTQPLNPPVTNSVPK